MKKRLIPLFVGLAVIAALLIAMGTPAASAPPNSGEYFAVTDQARSVTSQSLPSTESNAIEPNVADTSQGQTQSASNRNAVKSVKPNKAKDEAPSFANAQKNRHVTGNGKTRKFAKGDSVAGEVITLRGGKTFYQCYMAKAPSKGKVTSGVINPWNKEVRNLPSCSDTQSSPGPRDPTGKGKWGRFHKGDYVQGFVIEVNGRTYFDCLMKPAHHKGRVLDGIVNPSRFEMQGETACSSTSNWRPGYRTESGDGSLRFAQGDYVLGAYLVLDNGGVVNNGQPCHMVAPSAGTLYGGVRNYWPGEDKGLSAC